MNISLKKANLSPIPTTLKSGDVLLIRLLDGLDPLIMWGTGSHIGHTAVFISNKDGDFIYESTDANPLEVYIGHLLMVLSELHI